MERSRQIKELAEGLGFDACGIASAADAIDPAGRFEEWLARGFHADMRWMERTRSVRLDVQKKLPGTRSVVVVARNYYRGRPAAAHGTGKVARYAWGRDYHKVLLKRLRSIAATLDGFEAGASSYCCIDSGPVLEKFWAARAGVGWIGKNSLVLNRNLGSWFVLGAILTTVELEPDRPMRDQCGSCTACIEACPTDAIVEPRVVDSTRCISYHTIENRGDVPEPLGRHFGDWVFGCDICQEVCPYNRRTPETDEDDFAPRTGHVNPDLEMLERIDERAFRETYAGSPIMRAKHPGMQRNAAIARRNREGIRE